MMRTEERDVTPEQANKWLSDCNHGNRPLSKHVVEKYASDMRDGLWLLTHQGPAFDEDGRLIDGQHRLAAVVSSGVAVSMSITFGADSRTFAVLDIHHKRRGAHLIPGPNAVVKAAIARLLTKAPRIFYEPSVHNRDIVRIYHEHLPEIEVATELSTAVYKATRINASMHGALLTLALASDAAPTVEAWVQGLTTGAGLNVGDPRLPLRNKWALESSYLNNNVSRNDTVFYIIRAWNAYVKNETITKLQLPKGGIGSRNDIPIPVLEGPAA